MLEAITSSPRLFSAVVTGLATLVGALVGGIVSLYATRKSNETQREIEQGRREEEADRLRRAFVTEIQSLGIGQIHAVLQIAKFAGQVPAMACTFQALGRPKQQARMQARAIRNSTGKNIADILEVLHGRTLSTAIYESNSDKIGRLEPRQISEIVEFYRYLADVEMIKERVLEAYDEENYEKVATELQNLDRRISELRDKKKDTLEALNAEEFEDEENAEESESEEDETNSETDEEASSEQADEGDEGVEDVATEEQ